MLYVLDTDNETVDTTWKDLHSSLSHQQCHPSLDRLDFVSETESYKSDCQGYTYFQTKSLKWPWKSMYCNVMPYTKDGLYSAVSGTGCFLPYESQMTRSWCTVTDKRAGKGMRVPGTRTGYGERAVAGGASSCAWNDNVGSGRRPLE